MDADKLKSELLSMAAEDLRIREELARDGSLFAGYHPRMMEVRAHDDAFQSKWTMPGAGASGDCGEQRSAASATGPCESSDWEQRDYVGGEVPPRSGLLEHRVGTVGPP